MKSVRLFVVLVSCLVCLFGVPAAHGVAQEGNSDAAHACHQRGYNALVGSNYETFANTGECVSFAANGGSFATGIIVPKGETLTFVGPRYSACNTLSYGYTANGAAVAVDTFAAGCRTETRGNVTVGPFATAFVIEVTLTDVTCGGVTYTSSGFHGQIEGGYPSYLVGFADAGPGCRLANTVPQPFPTALGNFSVRLLID